LPPCSKYPKEPRIVTGRLQKFGYTNTCGRENLRQTISPGLPPQCPGSDEKQIHEGTESCRQISEDRHPPLEANSTHPQLGYAGDSGPREAATAVVRYCAPIPRGSI
jgi:hypothetical protein